MPVLTYLEAIRQGIWEEMERDPSVFLLGEDIGTYGGAFKVTAGMLEKFGRTASLIRLFRRLPLSAPQWAPR